MAVFLLKAKHGSDYTPSACFPGIFLDVPCPSPFADWIQQLFQQGITGGCGPSLYCPDAPVTRAQMAVFLLKASLGASYVPPECTGTVFSDVPCSGGAFDAWIEDLAGRGITGGCGGGDFCPGNANTRGPDGGVPHEDVRSDPLRAVMARWRHLSYRRGRGWPSASLKLGVAYCRGSSFGGRLLVKTFGLELYTP